jgi:hypothetical protein
MSLNVSWKIKRHGTIGEVDCSRYHTSIFQHERKLTSRLHLRNDLPLRFTQNTRVNTRVNDLQSSYHVTEHRNLPPTLCNRLCVINTQVHIKRALFWHNSLNSEFSCTSKKCTVQLSCNFYEFHLTDLMQVRIHRDSSHTYCTVWFNSVKCEYCNEREVIAGVLFRFTSVCTTRKSYPRKFVT